MLNFRAIGCRLAVKILDDTMMFGLATCRECKHRSIFHWGTTPKRELRTKFVTARLGRSRAEATDKFSQNGKRQGCVVYKMSQLPYRPLNLP